jgi:hypothetical protein
MGYVAVMNPAVRSLILPCIAVVAGGHLWAQTLTDIGTSAPSPGTNDIYQLSTQGNTTSPDTNTLNYFTDNQTGHGTGEPGQTFTTGTNVTGYVLTSVAVRTGGIGTSSGTSTAQPYYLHIYLVSGSTATLLQTYASSNITFNDGDWLKWTGFPVLLRLVPNATYAYSFGKASSTSGWEPMAVATNAYAGGEIALIPTSGGTITTGSSHKFDAVFDIGLQPAAAATNIPASMPWPNPTYGMNVGNELELNWGPPNIALFYSAAQNGFNAVRIPCAWDMAGATTNISGGVTNYVISPSYMAQVKQTVDGAIAAGMYVMINDHWDDGWLQQNIGPTVDPIINAKVKAYWTQIATTFAGYDNHLLFAACNEPNVTNTASMGTLIFYYQTFVNAVRNVGGNNTNRWLVLQGGGDTMWLNSLPTDMVTNRLMVEYHNYTPFQFTQLQGDASWGPMQYFWGPAYHYSGDPSHDCGTPEEGAMDAGFQQLVDQYVSKGIPVMIGEFQAAGKSVLSTNATEQAWNSLSCYYWNKYLVDSAHAHGMSPFYWSTGGSPLDYGTGAVNDTNAVRVLTGGVAFPPTNGYPFAASGLIATLSNNTNVNLSWTAGSGATSYNLYRAAESGGEPTNPVVTGITSTSYTDTNLNSGTTYYYQVVAVNGSGPTGYSPEAHATTTGVNPDPAQYNFETDPQSWYSGGGIITGIVSSSARAYAGRQSLAVNFNSAAAGNSSVTLDNAPIIPGATITFRYWLPSGHKVSDIKAYLQDYNWAWSQTGSGSLTANAWNTLTLTVPATDTAPLKHLWLGFTTSAGWTNTCYIDSISWNTLSPDFSVSANPTSLTVQGGSSGTSTMTLTALNGLNGCYTFSATNLPSGVTATFDANPITGGASTLTFTASNTVTSGTSNVTVTATCGSLSHTTTIALTLTPFAPPAATNFTWSVPTPITTADATLSPPSGSVLVGAATFGGTAYTVTLTNGTQINFTANGSVATATGSGTATGSFSGNTSNANFNAVLNEFNYDGGPKTITLNNLTAGSRYIVMFFGLDDRSPENIRQAYLQDPNLSGDVSQTWQMGSNVCVMGAFTATSSTKTLIEQLPGNSSGGDVLSGNANALVLWMVASSNTAPVLAVITNQTVNVAQTVAFTASATDTDQPPQTLTFSLLAGPGTATLNAGSGAFSWTPQPSDAGTTNGFTIKVADNGSPSLSATQSFSVMVNKQIPVLTAPVAMAITYGQTLASSSLSGGAATNSVNNAAVAGSFAFTTPATAPGTGTASQSVTFTPTDTAHYNPTNVNVSVTVNKQTPVLKAPVATAITYGQTLTNSSLSGGAATNSANNASVAGSFAFTTPTTAPGAGTANQSVTFTPSDTTDYNSAIVNVSVTVNKQTPVLKAPVATAIAYGQTLTNSSLSGGAATNSANNASVAGSFAFTTPATAPGAGTANQSVTFTPSDTTDYNSATVSVSVTVNQASPAFTFSSSKNPSGYHEGVIFTASLPTNAIGTVNFLTNGVLFDTRTLSSGSATATNSTLPNGTNLIAAIYSGDSNYLGRTNALNQVVTNTPPVLAVISNRTVNVGQTVAFTASATDTDSPPQTLTFALLAGATNATLNTNSGAFSFRPLVTQANSTNNFTLQVSDNGTPSLSATQSFSVVVNPLSAPGMSSSLSFAGGQLTISVSGQSGPDYAIETSTNLSEWNNVFITNSPVLPFTWTDPATNSPQRFYRIKLGPPLP